MKLPRSVLEKMKQQGQSPPASGAGGKARARAEEERVRRGLDHLEKSTDAAEKKDPEQSKDHESANKEST